MRTRLPAAELYSDQEPTRRSLTHEAERLDHSSKEERKRDGRVEDAACETIEDSRNSEERQAKGGRDVVVSLYEG